MESSTPPPPSQPPTISTTPPTPPSTSTIKPTLIFIPGAFHTPAYFNPFINLLKAHNYPVLALHLPSVGGTSTSCTVESDAVFIQGTITKLVEDGKDVVLIMHSYGGLPGTRSVQGLAKADREKKGLKGGVVGLLYIAAFVVREGESLASANGEVADWIEVERGQTYVTDSTALYNDLTASEAAHWTAQLKPQCALTITSPMTYAAWRHVPATFLFCEQDQAMPLALQRRMVDAAEANADPNGGGKVVFTRVSCKAGHSPMLSMPDFVAEVVRRVAGEEV